jgi:hypothetical protein
VWGTEAALEIACDPPLRLQLNTVASPSHLLADSLSNKHLLSILESLLCLENARGVRERACPRVLLSYFPELLHRARGDSGCQTQILIASSSSAGCGVPGLGNSDVFQAGRAVVGSQSERFMTEGSTYLFEVEVEVLDACDRG